MRWPELLTAHVKIQNLRHGSGLKAAKTREVASAGTCTGFRFEYSFVDASQNSRNKKKRRASSPP